MVHSVNGVTFKKEHLDKIQEFSEKPVRGAANELKIIMKNSDVTHTKKFLLYDPFMLDHSDSTIQKCIEETREGFVGEPEDIVLRVSMVLR